GMQPGASLVVQLHDGGGASSAAQDHGHIGSHGPAADHDGVGAARTKEMSRSSEVFAGVHGRLAEKFGGGGKCAASRYICKIKTNCRFRNYFCLLLLCG